MPCARSRWTVLMVGTALLILAGRVQAHCDSLDGPVIRDARAALQKGDVQPVLKWVKPEYEAEIRGTFAKAVRVRSLSDDARDVADLHFFETLVRLHRAGEGVAYSGLKPAGSVDPGIRAADEALAHGSVDSLAHHLAEAVTASLRERFAKAVAARAHAEDSVDTGRAYVAAYVEFVHFVEALSGLVSHADHAAANDHSPHQPGH